MVLIKAQRRSQDASASDTHQSVAATRSTSAWIVFSTDLII
jgi:hypothetical protein